ncbi:MAG TPA: RNA ligase (ATP) [Tepidisphaeraceae bacterium]|jgi:RNA ligase (TIGR02306 family)|nr:RNA ligase (ATP) [Tepidisphaeraceae bacterium]
MSSLIVEISRIEKVLPHSNAERLELAHVKGWQCVVPKGKYATGDLVTYVPPDSVLPVELSDRLGITKYLSKGRVRCARLRGEPSFGVIIDRENAQWTEGHDVSTWYGITKYLPPVRATVGDAEPAHPLFVSYTEIENMRNFPEVMAEGEEVVVSEKIHGTNCRVGMVQYNGAMTWMAGSKGVRRKMPAGEAVAADLYWHPYSLEGVRSLVEACAASARQVILFGEVYGKVQSLRYGVADGIAFRAFDLLVGGKYVDHAPFNDLCLTHGVERAPVVYRGPFSLERIKQLAEGNSTLPGADNIREGVVVKPVVERLDPKIGRVVLKYIGDGYLLGNESDTTDL